MHDEEFNAAAEAARRGRMKMEDFARLASERWKRWAAVFDRRYRLPAWLTRDDLEQELALAAWTYWDRFDPERGGRSGTPCFGRYIEWNAVKRTAKTVHKARGVEQHRRKGPSRFEAPLSAFSDEVLAQIEPSTPATQEDAAARSAQYSALAGRAGPRAPIVRALAGCGGEVDAASLAVYADPRLRLDFRLSSRAEAATLVKGTIVDLASETEEATS